MPLQALNLDDRRFQELFEELRALIPRYAPEWAESTITSVWVIKMHFRQEAIGG